MKTSRKLQHNYWKGFETYWGSIILEEVHEGPNFSWTIEAWKRKISPFLQTLSGTLCLNNKKMKKKHYLSHQEPNNSLKNCWISSKVIIIIYLNMLTKRKTLIKIISLVRTNFFRLNKTYERELFIDVVDGMLLIDNECKFPENLFVFLYFSLYFSF